MSKAASTRIGVRRAPKRARYECEWVCRVMDRGRVAHIAFVHEGQPFCIPTLYARTGNRLLIHGSSASRMVRRLGVGAPACVTVTILDGLVLARSAFEHSVNYDSAVLVGTFEPITDPDEMLAALEAFLEGVLPGRWREVRPPNRKELKATAVLAMQIGEASVKTRSAPPDDDSSPGAESDTWAGVIPVHTGFGAPVPSPGLRPGISVSPSVEDLVRRGAARSSGAVRADQVFATEDGVRAMTATPATSLRELDHRRNDGIDVRLLWDARTDRVSLAVVDERLGESLIFEVDPRDALAAFQHPYAYGGTGAGLRARGVIRRPGAGTRR